MGYTTLKGGKIVIWTNKGFVADKWPFHDEGENYTFFYKNLRGPYFAKCLARESEEFKKNLVNQELGIPSDNIVLRSRKSHMNNKNSIKKS